mgnify:CR=1 FL=1
MNSARPPETSAHERLYRSLRQRIMLGELIGRGVFYALYMTVGLL